MKKKVTYSELLEVIAYINNTSNISLNIDIDDKLSRKAIRFMKNIKDLMDEYNERLADINIDYASTYESGDKKGTLIKDQSGNLSYTPKNQKERNKKVSELNKEEIEIYVTICEDHSRVKTLSPILKLMLNGYLFDIDENFFYEEQEKQLEAHES
jgi:hypothetical protein